MIGQHINSKMLVEYIRNILMIFPNEPRCMNYNCSHYLNHPDYREHFRHAELIPLYYSVDVNGYTVDWACSFCDYKTTTGNMHRNLRELTKNVLFRKFIYGSYGVEY